MSRKGTLTQKFHTVARPYFNQGDHSDNKFFKSGHIRDVGLNNNAKELRFPGNQRRAMRRITPYHFESRIIEAIRRIKLYEKNK